MDLKLFRKISYGLYVVGSIKEDKINGQIANTVFQISSEPAMVAVSINKKNLTHDFIGNSKIFSVSILPASVSLDFIGLFGFKSGRDINKYASVSFKQGDTGAPILLENSLGYLEAKVINSLDVETHTVFIGRVGDAQVLSDEEPLTYAHYQQVKRGLTPATAPLKAGSAELAESKTYPNQRKKDDKMQKFQCTVCGYIYDPAIGDEGSGIAPGTAFADLPEDWTCPLCGVTKDQFQPV